MNRLLLALPVMLCGCSAYIVEPRAYCSKASGVCAVVADESLIDSTCRKMAHAVGQAAYLDDNGQPLGADHVARCCADQAGRVIYVGRGGWNLFGEVPPCLKHEACHLTHDDPKDCAVVH